MYLYAFVVHALSGSGGRIENQANSTFRQGIAFDRDTTDILLIRADREIPVEERRKLALFCNVRPEAVIQALDAKSIYDVPLAYHEEGLDQQVLDAFGIDPAPKPKLEVWKIFPVKFITLKVKSPLPLWVNIRCLRMLIKA